MKLRALLLGLSATVNVALAAAFIAKPSLAPSGLRALFASRDSRLAAETSLAADKAEQARAAAVAAAKAATKRQTELWSALQSDDLPTLIARLRAAGFPPNLIRAIVDAQVNLLFRSRMQALLAESDNSPYWQPSLTSFNNTKFNEARQQIYRDRTKMMRSLLGDEALAIAGVDPTIAQRQRFGDLSKGKISLVQQISDDYDEMMSQVKAATNGITLPEDRAKLALLEREKHADLANILSPEELADYEMRNSRITQRLRGPLSLIDATDAEFRAIYSANLPYADIIYPNVTGAYSGTAETRQQRTEALAAINQQVKNTMGADRFAEWTRAQNYDYQQLARIAQQANLPASVAVAAFDMRSTVGAASVQIGDNAALSPEQKIAALRELALKTQAQYTSMLGTGSSAFLSNATWLQAIGNGYVVSFDANGNSTSFRQISPSMPAPKR